ncbi:protein kinase domain-containing protein [Sorangium sp. So ce117]|uniref:protein kinase domain-containing protein n=1 Tax=Sorangium sp. So ce117 TaxID=3133277 RepID=UPI003F648227
MKGAKPSVLISSDPRDRAWRDRLVVQLDVHALQGLLDPWDEHRINAGEERDAALRNAMDTASVAILIVTANFLASEFLQTDIVPRLLERRSLSGLTIVPLLATPCDWQGVAWLRALDLRPGQGRCLSEGSEHQITADLAEMAREVRLLISGVREQPLARANARSCTPSYPDDETRTISRNLELSRSRKAELESVGASTAEIDREILDLRRQLRRGGQLKAGDSLGEGRYLLLHRVGRGGFSVVWEALDRSTGKHVAVKVLHSDLAGDSIRRERLFRGAREMASLQHPAVVRVLEPHGEDDGYYYYVMELAANGDLRQAVLDQRIRSHDIVPIILKIGDALAEAHAKGIVHRDVKPANILLDASDEPKLTDFDLVNAAHTTGGTRTGALGTFLYAAPELLHHPQDADARADVYGLAMTAIFCLHGSELPHWVLRNPADVIHGLATSDAIKSTLRRATDWTKENRYSDARAFCDALGHHKTIHERSDETLPDRPSFAKSDGGRAKDAFIEHPLLPRTKRRGLLHWGWYVGAISVLAAGALAAALRVGRGNFISDAGDPSLPPSGLSQAESTDPSLMVEPEAIALASAQASAREAEMLPDAGALSDAAAPAQPVLDAGAVSAVRKSSSPAPTVRITPVSGRAKQTDARIPVMPLTIPSTFPFPTANDNLETCTATMPDGSKKVVPCK